MSRTLLLLAALGLVACEPAADAPAEPPAAPREATPDPNAEATLTSTLLVDYEGRLDDGTVFDSGERVDFRLPELISGMQEALVGMRAGESKTITIPPEKGYPEGIPGLIPPGSTLTFDVTVHEVR